MGYSDEKKSPFGGDAPEEEDEGEMEEEDIGAPTFPRSRIASTPPKLPEIGLEQRSFSPTPFSAAFASATTNTTHIPSPMSRTPTATMDRKRPDTTYTIYDEEDAYGGI